MDNNIKAFLINSQAINIGINLYSRMQSCLIFCWWICSFLSVLFILKPALLIKSNV